MRIPKQYRALGFGAAVTLFMTVGQALAQPYADNRPVINILPQGPTAHEEICRFTQTNSKNQIVEERADLGHWEEDVIMDATYNADGGRTSFDSYFIEAFLEVATSRSVAYRGGEQNLSFLMDKAPEVGFNIFSHWGRTTSPEVTFRYKDGTSFTDHYYVKADGSLVGPPEGSTALTTCRMATLIAPKPNILTVR